MSRYPLRYCRLSCLIADPASSLTLIRGSLDQVASTADITWVQPRVLEGSQLETLAQQFGAWREGVGKTEKSVEKQRRTAKAEVLAA